MKYVFDSSVAVKTVLTETDSDNAVRLIDEFRAHLHELIAPEVFHIEGSCPIYAHGKAT